MRAHRGRRVLLLAKRKAHTRIPAHWRQAFEALGHSVLWLRPSRWCSRLGTSAGVRALAATARTWRPDLIVVYKHDAPVELLDTLPRTIPRVIVYEDAPRELDARVLALARRSHLLLTTAAGQIPDLRAAGVPRAAWLRTGCDPNDHRPGRTLARFASDAAFIGTAGGEDRLALLRAVASKCDLRLYGKGWREALGVPSTRRDVYPRQYRDICASARIVIGIDPRADVYLYFSNRTWLTLGCGGFLLTRYVPGLEEVFTNHEHLAWYESQDEALALIDHYLARPEARERIARAGYAYVHRYHSFEHAAAELLSRVDATAPEAPLRAPTPF